MTSVGPCHHSRVDAQRALGGQLRLACRRLLRLHNLEVVQAEAVRVVAVGGAPLGRVPLRLRQHLAGVLAHVGQGPVNCEQSV